MTLHYDVSLWQHWQYV